MATIPQELLYIITGFLGLCFGSFVTAVSYRLPRNKNFINSRSFCPSCGHILKAIDLIPVFSWLFSFGKCRYCKTSIHPRYPLIEITQCLLFLLVLYLYGQSEMTVILQIFSVCLMIMIVVDFEYKIIPDRLQVAMFLVGGFYWYYRGTHSLVDAIIAIVAILVFMLGLRAFVSWWKKREAMGLGDIKFMVIVGLCLGLTPLPFFLFFSGIIGLAYGLTWQIIKKDAIIPFGPALAVSLFINMLFPDFYLNFMDIIATSLGLSY